MIILFILSSKRERIKQFLYVSMLNFIKSDSKFLILINYKMLIEKQSIIYFRLSKEIK